MTDTSGSAFLRLFSVLKKHDISFSSAESLTGGMFGSEFTKIPGSSEFYWGGVISYAADAKIRLLGVSPDIIKKYTVVSEQVAKAMAEGVLAVSGTDAAVAVTGIAGPGGGTDENPVGTVCISAALSGGKSVAKKFLFTGDRENVRMETCTNAALMLCNLIESNF